MIRSEIAELMKLGSFPASHDIVPNTIVRQQSLLSSIAPPVTDDEARELVKLFGPDDYYGGAWTVLHLIESAPSWPLADCLSDDSNEWVVRLRQRLTARNSGDSEEFRGHHT
jgi:hypothetical protein